MWRHAMFLLCLIAALSGTPLRQAEAASDFTRSLGVVGKSSTIETIDGGVGDDTEVCILKAGGDTQSLPAPIPLAMADGRYTSLTPASFLPGIGVRQPVDLLGLLPACATRRLAWLQCFLF